MFRTRKVRARLDQVESDKMARLEKAELELLDLKSRAHEAITILDARRGRNHWREAVEQMIQGAP